MKRFNLTTITTLLTFAATLGGCGVKVRGLEPTGARPTNDGNGVSLDGLWDSGCVAISGSSSYRSRLKFTGQTVDSTAALYNDAECESEMMTDHKAGTWADEGESNLGGGVRDVRLDLVTDDGVEVTLYDIAKLDGDTLIMGEQPGHFEGERPTQLSTKVTYRRGLDGDETGGEEPRPPVHTPPTSCPQLSGRYQMNMALFTISQTGCESMVWRNEVTYRDPNPTTETFAGDGVERLVSDRLGEQTFQKSKFTEKEFIVETRIVKKSDGSERLIKARFYRSTRPCRLYNPDGSNYLTRDLYYDGAESSSRCDFWSPRQ